MKHLSQVDQGHNIHCGIVGSSLKVVVDNGETYKSSFQLPRLMGLSVYDIMSIIP